MKIKLTNNQKEILIKEVIHDYPELVNQIKQGHPENENWIIDIDDDIAVEISQLCMQAVARSIDEEGNLQGNGLIYDDIGQIIAIGDE